ncbi:MAG: hypothetical protein CMJ69_12665 [Planctomycetaceae bacterium]|nr:hypothetical protein [Planctomycetaceae bacterium]
MRHPYRLLLLSLGLATLLMTRAEAHFLFIRIGGQAEAGRQVDVFFSEIARAGDPLFVPRIAHTKLWMQTTPGKFQPLKVRELPDRLRSRLPAGGAVAVSGECTWGVLVRDVPFLLRYFPGAIHGEAKTLNTLKPRPKVPLQITATVHEDRIEMVALANGKPLPGAMFTTVDDDLVNEELKADKNGRVEFRPDTEGHFCVYTKRVIPGEGVHKGKKYIETRDFATLAFHWPLIASGGDKEAITLFENALAKRANWAQFPGFTAAVVGHVDGRAFGGTARVAADGDVALDIDEKHAVEWVKDQLGSMALHRRAPSPKRPRPVLRFADQDDEHPLGRLLTFVGGAMASSYRVRDGEITVVNRAIGPQHMTITVLDNRPNAEGKSLPRSYSVQYWDGKSGKLLRTQSVQNRWTRVGRFDLPTRLTVTTASQTGLNVRSLRLAKHKLLVKAAR